MAPAGAALLLALVVPSVSARSAYVADASADSVSVIDTATNQASTTPITVGMSPEAIAITPDGKSAYVVNTTSRTVSVINTATNTASPTPITGSFEPVAIAITPDGKTAYVVNEGAENVSVINTATNTASPTAINVGKTPLAIAISPDQSPVAAIASLAAPRARPGVPVSLDASASKDLDGTIAGYGLDFPRFRRHLTAWVARLRQGGVDATQPPAIPTGVPS